MKKTAITLIDIYQNFLSSTIHQLTGSPLACRFGVTCSEYAKQSIKEKGVLKGTYMSFLRILKCQPFYNPAV
jgi:putative membrane protein insertion efficiency factor